MHPLVRLAKEALETYVKEGRIIKPPQEILEKYSSRAGVFVSIKKQGQLRGCIGTIYPVRETIAHEVIMNAIHAGTEDPRFMPVEEDELPYLTYSVDILGIPEKVRGPEELDPRKYGVIVSKGMRKGLLLPDLEGVNTVEEQLRIALMKAGITERDFEIYRFTVERLR